MTSIPLEISDNIYARLKDIAAARGETVPIMLETAAYRLSRRDIGSDEVGVLWAMGFTDRQIAYELDWTNQRVSNRRRSIGLPPNKHLKGTTR